MEIVTSSSNPRIKSVKRLHLSRERRATGRSIAEGPKALAAMLDAGIAPSMMLRTDEDTETAALAAEHGFDCLVVSLSVLTTASDTQHPQSPVVVFAVPEESALHRRNTVVLHDVSDPGNVGTIVRSAMAFGWDVAVAGRTTDPWGPKAIRSSAGSVFATRVVALESPLREAAAIGLTTIAALPTGGATAPQSAGPFALLVGSEAAGLPSTVADGADERFTISMPGGVESLNASVAAAIAMHVLGKSG
jgi:TrmH family RNA methyltransferase